MKPEKQSKGPRRELFSKNRAKGTGRKRKGKWNSLRAGGTSSDLKQLNLFQECDYCFYFFKGFFNCMSLCFLCIVPKQNMYQDALRKIWCYTQRVLEKSNRNVNARREKKKPRPKTKYGSGFVPKGARLEMSLALCLFIYFK